MAFSPANRTVNKRNVFGAHINFCVQRVAAMRHTYKRRKKNKTNKNPNHFLCVAFLIAFCLPFKFMFMTFFCFSFIKIQMILACNPSTSPTLLFYVCMCAGSPQFVAAIVVVIPHCLFGSGVNSHRRIKWSVHLQIWCLDIWNSTEFCPWIQNTLNYWYVDNIKANEVMPCCFRFGCRI